MNRFKSIIEEVESEGSMSLVKLKSGNNFFTSIVLDNPQNSNYLFIGNEIEILFKETEVIIDTNTNHNSSLRNRILGNIEKIEHTAILSKIVLKTEVGTITSIITRGSAERLNLKIDDTVFAMIKTNEIILSH
ncbi:TOBE domain-containing protein [Hyphobacterium sp. CCMP332]|nr:TOBE domain-containing protein [Hyphobacterium sp. CCMP332]